MGSTTWRIEGALVIKVVARRGSFLLVPHVPMMTRQLCDALIALGRRERCVFVRVCPLMIDTVENRAIFTELNFKPAPMHVHPEFAWILDLRKTEDQLLADMRKTTRYTIRKAEKDGIVAEVSTDQDDIERFWKLYELTAQRQQFVPYSKKSIADEFRAFGDHAFWVFSSEAAAMIIIDGTEGFYHHGASTHHPTASYAVQWAAIREVKRRGCDYYNFWGVWPAAKKEHPQYGLSQFKRGFGGFEEAYVPTQDFKLSNLYYLTNIIERVRKMKRGF